MSRLVLFITILSAALMLSACGGSAPITLAPWQPWARTLKTTTAIPAASRIRVEIKGQNNVLLGDEQLMRNKIQEKLTQVLTRKGLKAGTDTYDFKLILTYKTDRYDKSEAAKIATPRLGGVVPFAGQGVTIAGKVGTFAPVVPPQGQSSIEQPALFQHVVSVELFSRAEMPVWKGEESWTTPDPDIQSSLTSILLVLLSDIQSDASFQPIVPEIKLTHTTNYYEQEAKGNWFYSPALPYRVTFEKPADLSQSSGLPSSIKNPNVLAAYLDLIQTAEYALPGAGTDWKNPVQLSNWNDATLGGQYFLGTPQKPVTIMINVTLKEDCYVVDKCWIPTPLDFKEFQDKMLRYKRVLKNYYNVFEK
jgi:hypothetical protein